MQVSVHHSSWERCSRVTFTGPSDSLVWRWSVGSPHQLAQDVEVTLQHDRVIVEEWNYLLVHCRDLRAILVQRNDCLKWRSFLPVFSPLPASSTTTSGRAIKMGGWRLDWEGAPFWEANTHGKIVGHHWNYSPSFPCVFAAADKKKQGTSDPWWQLYASAF